MDQSDRNAEFAVMSGFNCIICGKGQPAYKCPTCYAKYCSVECCKNHKLGGNCGVLPLQSEQEPEEFGHCSGASRNYYYPTKDTVPIKKLEVLSEGDNLMQLKKFFEDPTIRANILKLDTCTDPISEFMDVMENENFVKFSAFVTNELNNEEPKSVQRDLRLE